MLESVPFRPLHLVSFVRSLRMGTNVSLNKKLVSNNSQMSLKNRKFKFLKQGVLRDELLHVWEFSIVHSVQLVIPSYGLKTFSHDPGIFFNFCEKRWKMTKIKFLRREVLPDEFLHLWELSEWQSRHFFFLHMVKNYIFHFWYSKNKENQVFGTRSSSGWVLTCVRTFNFSSSTTFNFIIWS